MRSLCLALLFAALIPAVALAGGGGSKPTSTIKVKNLGSDLLAVIVDPTSSNFSDLDAFRKAGGKTLNSGESEFFKVKEGSHTVHAAFIENSAGSIGTTNVKVGKNKTVNVNATGAFSAAPGLSIN